MKKLRLKIIAILDIISNNKFYLITFDKDVKYRTEYGIVADVIHDKI